MGGFDFGPRGTDSWEGTTMLYFHVLKQNSQNYSKASGNGAFLSLVKATNDFRGWLLTSLVSKSSSLSSTTILYVFASGAPKERMCSYWKTSNGLPSPRLYTDTASALTPSQRSWGKPPSLHCGPEAHQQAVRNRERGRG